VEPKWFYCDDMGPKLGNKRKKMSQPGSEDLQRKARKTQLTSQPMDTRTGDLEGHVPRGHKVEHMDEVERMDDRMIVDLAEEGCPTMSGMVVDAWGMLIEGEDVNRAHADTDKTHQDERPASELDVAQADGQPAIVGEETVKIVSEETIKVFVGGKNAKAGTKLKNIDDYLKLFINTDTSCCGVRAQTNPKQRGA